MTLGARCHSTDGRNHEGKARVLDDELTEAETSEVGEKAGEMHAGELLRRHQLR